jgi:signal transduction histidine kinase
MQEFENSQTILNVPVEYTDEAGILLRQVHSTLVKIKTLTEERNNFVGLITHDLRNPLAATIGLAYLIKESSKEEEVLEYADLIHQSGQTGLKIITDIMNILKADDFSIDQSELETIEIKDFILKQIEAVKAINSTKNIEFVLNVEASDQLKVHSNFFSHILQNLLTNAIKFSHPNTKIKINGQPMMDNYKLEIIDSGIGFNQVDADKIFEKFTSLKREGTQNEPTTGLGLFLTKMLVKKHKGEIFATSNGVNQGATFTIII